MPKACVKQKMKQGMSRKAAVQACYPVKPGLKKYMAVRAAKAKGSINKKGTPTKGY